MELDNLAPTFSPQQRQKSFSKGRILYTWYGAFRTQQYPFKGCYTFFYSYLPPFPSRMLNPISGCSDMSTPDEMFYSESYPVNMEFPLAHLKQVQ